MAKNSSARPAGPIRARIENRNPDGRGRGQADGRTVLVSQAHPGEEIELRLDRQTRGTLQGRVRRLIESDPGRIDHPCRHEFICTGCPMLAADLESEAAFKLQRTREALEAAGAPTDVLLPVRRPAGPFGYRHFAKQVIQRRRGRVVLGSYVAGTHELADNAGCPVLTPGLARLMDEIGRRIEIARLPVARGDKPGLRYVLARQGRKSGKQIVLLVTSSANLDPDAALCRKLADEVPEVAGAHLMVNRDPGNALLAGRIEARFGADHIQETLMGFRHRVGPTSFFQINPISAEVLAREAVEQAGEGGLCVEGFSGVGALTLPLAQRFQRVRAIESSREATAHLRSSAQLAGFQDRLEITRGAVEEILPGWLQEDTPDAVVLDPPRRGLGEALTAALAARPVPRIVLLSCAPKTLAHDLPPLLAAGYRLERVLPIDQFPRTAHVETVSTLSHAGASQSAEDSTT